MTGLPLALAAALELAYLLGLALLVGRVIVRAGNRRNVFVIGLLLGPPLYRLAAGQWPPVTITASLPVIALAGLLVGFGTRMGSGCTSGHGIVGLARFSPRSAVAVATFLLAGIAAVTRMRLVAA